MRLATEQYVQDETGLYIPKSLVDVKGDLVVASGPDAVARLPVGADGEVLTADSSQANGIKWAAGASGSDYRKFIASLAPRAYYPMDDAAGPVVDWMGANYPDEESVRNLTDLGTGILFQQPGPPSAEYSMDFSSATSGARLATANALTGATNWTMFGWIRIPGSSGGIFFGAGDGTLQKAIALGVGQSESTGDGTAGTRLIALDEAQGWINSGFDIPANTWVPVSTAKNGGNWEIWAYGKLRISTNLISIQALNAGLGIGRDPWNAHNPAPGEVAHVAFWDRYLTAQEQLQLAHWRP